MTDQLVYMYGIVPSDAPDPPDELLGIEDARTRLVRSGAVAAIVSDVPLERYGDDALNARLDDLPWVGARGYEHERVLDWYVERGAVLPLSLFSLHSDTSRVENRLAAEEADFAGLLGRLAGRKEWGIKLWRREAAVREGIDKVSPSLQALNQQVSESPPGKRFLLERKRETVRDEEIRSVSARAAHELFGSLRRAADDGVSLALPAGVTGSEKTLLLHAAYLVRTEAFEEFQKAVTEQAARLSDAGFEIEFTGPWPPYHFAAERDD